MNKLTEDELCLIKMSLDSMIETCKFSRWFGKKTELEMECEVLVNKLKT